MVVTSKKEVLKELESTNITEEIRIFRSIQQLNWAWEFMTEDGPWRQFECLVCMILESKFQFYLENPQYFTVEIRLGVANFITKNIKRDGKVVALIRRTDNKQRERSDGADRYE